MPSGHVIGLLVKKLANPAYIGAAVVLSSFVLYNYNSHPKLYTQWQYEQIVVLLKQNHSCGPHAWYVHVASIGTSHTARRTTQTEEEWGIV